MGPVTPQSGQTDASETGPAGEAHPGRPRDASAGPALMAAALDLVRSDGYEGVTIARIIARAGVSRQSLYRRWPTKADLVLDALLASAGPAPRPGVAPVRQALRDFLLAIFKHLQEDAGVLRNLIAAAQMDEAFRSTLNERFVMPRGAMMIALFEDAVASGELPAEFDCVVVADMLHGAFWYRLLNGQTLDDALAVRLVTAALGPDPAA